MLSTPVVSTRQPDLFPDVDLGAGRERGEGCTSPIGRWRLRRSRPAPSRRPSTAALLAELRALMRDELGSLMLGLQRIERLLGSQGARCNADGELLKQLLNRLIAIERAVGLCEQPAMPRLSRKRPIQ